MIDLLLITVIVALAVRGWMRGLVRESISLAVLVVGLVLAFRLSTPGGAMIESLAGTTTDASRLVAGLVIFLLISATAAVISAVLHRGIRVMPGLPTINRAAGASLAVVAGVVIITMILSVAGVLSLPPALAEPVDDSTIASSLVDPVGPAQGVVGVISGDRVMEHVLRLQDAIGERRLVAGNGLVTIPASDVDDLQVADKHAAKVRELIERQRAMAQVDSLEPSKLLDDVAVAYALSVYESGRFSNIGATGDAIDDRLVAADVPVTSSAQIMVLATSPKSALEAAMGDERTASVVVDPSARRLGVGVVNGPLGLLVVQIYTG